MTATASSQTRLRYLLPVTETNHGYLSFETREEAQAFIDDPIDFDAVHWRRIYTDYGEVIDLDAPEQPEPPPPRWSDQEVLQQLVEILWPSEDPNCAWDSETLQIAADLISATRPELLPWSMSCRVDHSWAAGAYNCAWRRYALTGCLDDLTDRSDREYTSAFALAELANAWEARP